MLSNITVDGMHFTRYITIPTLMFNWIMCWIEGSTPRTPMLRAYMNLLARKKKLYSRLGVLGSQRFAKRDPKR